MKALSKLAIVLGVLRQPGYKWLFLLIWFIVLSIFIWLTRLNLLAYIFTQAQLDLTGKLVFVAKSYLNLFVAGLSPLPFSIIVFSMVAAASFTLVAYLARQSGKLSPTGTAGGKAMGAMVLGHVLSCGTSLSIPLVSVFLGAGSFVGGSRALVYVAMGVAANMLGTWLMMRELSRAATRVASLSAA